MSEEKILAVCNCGKPIFIKLDNGNFYCPVCKEVTEDKIKFPEEQIQTKKDKTRLFNLLRDYENHIITKYLDKQIPSSVKNNPSVFVEQVRKSINLIQNNL